MRKLLALSILFISFLSCSNDKNEMPDNNETPTTNIDPVIGTWKLIKKTLDDGGNPIDDTNDCTTKSTIVFTNDGMGDVETYNINDQSSNCEIEESLKIEWKKVSENNYSFNVISKPDENASFSISEDATIDLGATIWKKQ